MNAYEIFVAYACGIVSGWMLQDIKRWLGW